MLVAARSDEHESRLRPFPGARPPRRGQWTAGARQSPIAFVTAVKVPNDRMRGSQFSSWNISLPYRRYGCALFLCIALADPMRPPAFRKVAYATWANQQLPLRGTGESYAM